MNDVYQIFDDGLQRLARLDEIRLEGCFRLVTDLARVAAYSDFKQGVLVAEILKGVFAQIGPLFEGHDIPESDGREIKDKISQGVYSLSLVYKNDGNAAYEILADMRLAATKFYIKCHTTSYRLPRRQASSGGNA